MSRKRKKPRRPPAANRRPAASTATVAQTPAAARAGSPQAAAALRSEPPADRTRPEGEAEGEQQGALDAFVARKAPEVVGATWMFDPPQDHEVHTLHVRLIGKRVDDGGPSAGLRDRFTRQETWTVVPGSGPVAVTTKISDVAPGRWQVQAEASHPVGHSGAHAMGRRAVAVQLARWSWRRWSVLPAIEDSVPTRRAPFVPTPAVLLGSWLALVVTGIVVATVVQSLILSAQSVRLAHTLTVSLVSVLAGAIGAKAWYMVLHRQRRRRDGWAIQGFVAGFAVAAPLLLLALSVPAGRYLDATAPALLFGMAIGRLGCFFTGCCAGRPTASRWGVWSSNRTVGARRIPTQPLESLLAATVAVIALVVVLSAGSRHGSVFLAAVAAYTLIRQRVLLLREEQRQSRRGTMIVSGVAAFSLLAAGVVGVTV